jgi:hypothetical protein
VEWEEVWITEESAPWPVRMQEQERMGRCARDGDAVGDAGGDAARVGEGV